MNVKFVLHIKQWLLRRGVLHCTIIANQELTIKFVFTVYIILYWVPNAISKIKTTYKNRKNVYSSLEKNLKRYYQAHQPVKRWVIFFWISINLYPMACHIWCSTWNCSPYERTVCVALRAFKSLRMFGNKRL